MIGSPLRLMVFDRTCTRRGLGLSTAWSAGALLYRGLGRFDASLGVATWEEALEWLGTFEPTRPIAEIQYWGHGRWGRVLVGKESFDAAALVPGHRLHAKLLAVKERLVPSAESLVWFRTCEAFGARAGIDFAERLVDTLGVPVAGHTFVIGALQSGLHGLRPGMKPRWSAVEGLARGTAEKPLRARESLPGSPNTITCFDNVVPEAWFD